jgi:hypothetical protein
VTPRVWILATMQIASLLSWAGYHEYVWATAPTFRIPLQPRDPYDLLRGRYFVLNPQDGTLVPSDPLSEPELRRFLGDDSFFSGGALVGLCRSGDVHRVCRLRRLGQPAPADDGVEFWSRGSVTVREQEKRLSAELDLGLSRFFIPNRVTLPGPENASGWELELSHRPEMEPLPRRLFFKGEALDLK